MSNKLAEEEANAHIQQPSNCAVVPREITLEMQHAYFDVINKNMERVSTDPRFGRYDSNREAYRAMIAAAPVVSVPKRESSNHIPDAKKMVWQSIETAPKDGTEILLYAFGDIGVCYWRDDSCMTGWTWGAGRAFHSPSHWMPLPGKPTTQIGGEQPPTGNAA